MALINPKYFVTSTFASMNLINHNKDWAELKKYAPVAGIKEMGYFDTGVGQSSVDWLKSEEYEGLGNKVKAFFTDGSYRDEILSKAPSLMDEIGWVQIWNAVKKETAATTKLKVGSEEFLKAAGERFTEVVSLTQVYDSVLSRSGMMRSKDTGMKMATAFMSEPTVQLNMLVDAAIQGKRKGGFGGVKVVTGTFGAVLSSVVLNALLKAIVTAGRDDDEDKTYLEKYIGAAVGDLVDSLNPLTLVPFAKDVVSIFQGYDVTRMDMNLISDLKKAIDNLDSENKTGYEKISGVATALAAFFGVPLKNIERDIRGVVNTIKSFGSGQKTTSQGIGQAIKEAITGEADSNAEQLYAAIVSGDQTQIDRVKSRYKDEDAVEAAMRSAVKEHYLAGDIDSETAMEYLIDHSGMEGDDAYWKIQEWDYEQENGSSDEYSKYDDFITAVETGKNLKAVIKEYTDNGVEAKTLASQITKHFKPLYIEMSKTERASIKGYLLNAYALLGYDRAKKSKDIDKWLEE